MQQGYEEERKASVRRAYEASRSLARSFARPQLPNVLSHSAFTPETPVTTGSHRGRSVFILRYTHCHERKS